MKKERFKHNYTSEMELKSLLIRVKNKNFGKEPLPTNLNKKINKYIKWFNALNDKRYKEQALTTRKNEIKRTIKNKIIKWSEQTNVDDKSYNRFGEIILLMIKKILTKPQFSGYTYRDEFYSDAVHKILKYLHNFDHTLISEISGTEVNAFAYISQIIHNSVLFIINYKNKELKEIKKQMQAGFFDSALSALDLKQLEQDKINESKFVTNFERIDDKHEISVNGEEILKHGSLYNYIIEKELDNVKIKYSDYRISLDEYDRLKPLLKTIEIYRKNEKEENANSSTK